MLWHVTAQGEDIQGRLSNIEDQLQAYGAESIGKFLSAWGLRASAKPSGSSNMQRKAKKGRAKQRK